MSGAAAPRAPLPLAPALLGCFSVVAQTLLARELLVVFHGSELPLGIVFACWLLLGGAGSLAAARALSGRVPRPREVAAVAAAACAALPLSVLAVRHAAAWLPLAPGEVAGARVGTLAALATLAAPAGCGGAWFALSAARWRDASGPGRAYAWEAAGGLVGGLVFTFALAGSADAFTLSAVVAAVIAAAAWGASPAVAPAPTRRGARLAAAGVGLALAAVLAASLGPLARRSQRARWPGLEVLDARDGRHATLALVASGGLTTLFENGSPAFSFPDPETAEAEAHLPLLAARDVGRLLLTEAALGGALAEALKHPAAHVDLIVSSREILPLLRPALPPGLDAALDDPRVQVHEGDLRAWLAGRPGEYDAVLLGRVEPTSALANRVATREFFDLLRRALRPRGVASLSLPSAPNYRGEELVARNASVLAALASAFPRVEALRDDPLTLLAGSVPGPPPDAQLLAARLRERRIAARTLTPETIAALMGQDRAGLALAELRAAGAPANTDTSPAAYLHHVRHREAASDPAAAGWLSALSGGRRWLVFALPAALAALSLLPRPAASRARRLCVAVAATGAVTMGLQFLLFFVYQTARGALYGALGILSGLFMGGVAAGGALALRGRGGPPGRPLVAAAGALVLAPPLAGAAFALLLGPGGAPAAATDLAAALVAVAVGSAAGLAFPLLALAHPSPGAGAGGALYAWELVGAAGGALAVSLWLLPLCGLPATLAFLTLLAASAWAFALRGPAG